MSQTTAEAKAPSEYLAKRDPALSTLFAIFMAVAIAAIGWVMMTISSSPTVKGASFLWLPAALALAAGVWLGPWKGFLAAGLGSYAAGILAYGGWGIVDIIMNVIAGGFMNASLPAFLFPALKIDPSLGAKRAEDVLGDSVRILALMVLVVLAGLVNIVLKLPGSWGLLIPFVVLILGLPFLRLKLEKRYLLPAVGIAVVSCLASAVVGAIGATVGGKPFVAALLDPGVGWFFGDTVSAILGLFLLPLYTQRLRNAGITR